MEDQDHPRPSIIPSRKALFFFGWVFFTFATPFIIVGVGFFSRNPNQVRDNQLKPRDLAYILPLCNLGDHRIEKVLHSHVVNFPSLNKQVSVFAIKISPVDAAMVMPREDRSAQASNWRRCDQLPKYLNDVLGAVDFRRGVAPWFPTAQTLRSSRYYLCPVSIDYHKGKIDTAKLAFLFPDDSVLFFIDGNLPLLQ